MLASTAATKWVTASAAGVSGAVGTVVASVVNDPLGVAPWVGGGAAVLLGTLLWKVLTRWMDSNERQLDKRGNTASIGANVEHIEEQLRELKEAQERSNQGKAMWILLSQQFGTVYEATGALLRARETVAAAASSDEVARELARLHDKLDETRGALALVYQALQRKTNFKRTDIKIRDESTGEVR